MIRNAPTYEQPRAFTGLRRMTPLICGVAAIAISLSALSVSSASGLYGFGAGPGLEGDIRQGGGVGSPVLAKQDGVYYTFTGGAGINIRRSYDSVLWDKIGTALPTGTLPAWAEAEFPEKDDNSLWAPDISYFNGQYHLYYCVSTLGSSHSAIGFATSPTLDPAAPNYGWTDHGSPVVVTQHKSALTNPNHYNAIDPNIAFDDGGNPWLVFGSYWSGIKVRQINPLTGEFYTNPADGDTQLHSIARRTVAQDGTRAVEAPFVVRKNGYYWLFVSFDPQPTHYKVMVGRSTSITGPYIDFQGNDMMQGGGTLVLDGYADVTAPGHTGVLLDERGTDWLIHHYKDERVDGARTLMMHELIWGPDGWPVVGEPHNRDSFTDITVPIELGAFAHSVNFSDNTSTLQFLPGGSITSDNEPTEGTWTLSGDVLTMVWPDSRAPGGAYVDKVTLADHGRWYVGRNQNGTVIRGVRTEILAGDFDGNGFVNAADYVVWRKQLASGVAGSPADSDRDGVIEATDLNSWKLNFGKTSYTGRGALATAPEPGCLPLGGMAVMVGALARLRTPPTAVPAHADTKCGEQSKP